MLVLVLVFLVVALVGTTVRRQYWYLIAVAVAGIAVNLIISGDTFLEASQPMSALLAVTIGLTMVDVVRAANDRRTAPTRNDAWTFDTALDRETRTLVDQLRSEPTRTDDTAWQAWRTVTLATGREAIARIERLRAPTREWDRVARAYLLEYRGLLDSLELNRAADVEAVNGRISGIDAEMLRLRSEYSTTPE